MVKPFCIISLFFIGCCVHSVGQTPAPPPNLLPTIVSASPEVSAFAKYGNYEVNLFNGTQDISIPLYEINIGGLKLPISINYNTSGVRVNDVPTNIGLGWSLNAGGAITRKVMGGLPDEYNISQNNVGHFGYLNGGTAQNLDNPSFHPGSTNGLQYLRDVADNHRIDPEPDIFSYSFPGKSGKFIFSQENNLKPFFIPYQPLKVSYTIGGGSTSMLLGMTDESGISYQFNTTETSLNSGQILPVAITSSWLMTKLASPNGQDSITFSYSNGPTLNETFSNDNLTVIDQVFTNTAIAPYTPVYVASPFAKPPLNPYTYSQINQKNLDNIKFRNGMVVFQPAPEARLDLKLTGLKNRMQKIIVYNLVSSVYSVIREIDFYHSYFIRYASYASGYDSTSSRRLRLDSLIIRDGKGVKIQKYKFDYNNHTDNYGLPDQNAKCIDYWGNYNGKFTNSLVPRQDISYSPTTISIPQTISVGASTYGTRNPDSTFMQSGMLNKITYPTGGYTIFTYETNQYSKDNTPANAALAGGLRIRQTRSFDGLSSTPIVKTYKYGQNESGFGVQNFMLNNYSFQTSQSNRYWVPPPAGIPLLFSTKVIRTFLASPTTNIEPWDAAPVAYPYVTEYNGDENSNTGKTVYQFNNVADGISSYQYMGGATFVLSNHYHRGQVLFKSVYRQNVDKSYTMIAQTENQYAAFPDSVKRYTALSVTHNMYSEGYNPFNTGTVDQGLQGSDYTYGSSFNGTVEYTIFNYPIYSGDNRLTQTTERTYDQNSPSNFLATTTNYYYNNFNHMQPTRVVTSNSKGEVITDSIKYASEFAQAGNVYQMMVNKNLLNVPIQDKKTNNNAPISLKLTNYYDAGYNNFLPQSIQMQVASNPIETRANFLGYDQYGNITSMQKTGDVIQSYVWDYKKVYPIATVVNASQTDVAGTSFEAEGTGNWAFSGVPVADASSPTGAKCYLLSTGNIIKSGLTSTNSYVFSFWQKAGSHVTLTGGTYASKTGKTINGWTYYEDIVTGATTITVSGTGYIDELRLYPSRAQMITYTYHPLVGINSTCDADNKITYYFYDAFGRLKWIKDQDGNIIKTIQYHYQGIPGLQ